MIVFAAAEFFEIDAAFAFETYVDYGVTCFDCSDRAHDDAAFKALIAGAAELFVKERFEIVARGVR